MERRTFVAALALTASLSLVSGCLQREIVETEPQTTNVFVKHLRSSAIDKIDLLFVVDNSASMGDKQAIFERAVPRMLGRLVRPDCVQLDEMGRVVERRTSDAPLTSGEDPSCPEGWGLEFEPVDDIHIGVITSSLGGTGSTACQESEKNDRALLIPKVRPDVPDPHGSGFLVWHPPAPDDPPNTPVEDDFSRLESHFRAHITAAGEKGCGFEAPLEAWYRFLVDPSPPLDFTFVEDKIQSTGVDSEVLRQRAEFLRPDSLVAIILLTDENDCSVKQGGPYYPFAGSGWAIGETKGERHFPVATTACETNPNDPCCFSCSMDEVPKGCDDESALLACDSPGQPRLSAEEDRANVRCFENKRRFGIDLLYPTDRYVSGLSSSSIIDSQTGKKAANPLLQGVSSEDVRPPGLVFLAGVTGVPYQDIENASTRNVSQSLQYLRASELRENVVELSGRNRWDLILGSPGRDAAFDDCEGEKQCGEAPVPPLDPFMTESIEPREGENPLLGISTTTSPQWNPINGHEVDNSVPFNTVGGIDSAPAQDDLQYSCIFPLSPYTEALPVCDGTLASCDCGASLNKDPPLCKEGEGATASETQHFGKAYPAPRILKVLQDFGANSVVASICPKVHDPSAADYGYNPAVEAIIEPLVEVLKGQCFSRALSLDADGSAECRVIEVSQRSNRETGCEIPGRSPVDADVTGAVRRELETSGWCLGDQCQDTVVCEIEQLPAGEERDRCLQSPLGTESDLAPGYCYVDPESGVGSPALVARCPSTERRLLRFVGQDVPLPDATTLIACAGGTISKKEL